MAANTLMETGEVNVNGMKALLWTAESLSHTSSSHKQHSADHKKRKGIGEGKGAGKRYTLPGEGDFVYREVVAKRGQAHAPQVPGGARSRHSPSSSSVGV